MEVAGQLVKKRCPLRETVLAVEEKQAVAGPALHHMDAEFSVANRYCSMLIIDQG